MAKRKLNTLVIAATAATIASAHEIVPPELTPIREMPEYWRAIVEEIREIKKARGEVEALKLGMQPPLRCDVVVETQAVIWGEPHLSISNPYTSEPDQLRLQGPHPIHKTWKITPVRIPGQPWHHPWANGVYLAVPIVEWTDRFLIHNVRANPHTMPPGETKHLYRMWIRFWDEEDGCPKYVDFYSLAHEGEQIDDDPGHAGTGR